MEDFWLFAERDKKIHDGPGGKWRKLRFSKGTRLDSSPFVSKPRAFRIKI